VGANILTLSRLRLRTGWNSLLQLREHSVLKILVILVFAAGLWVGLFLLFIDGFRFLGTPMLEDLRPFVIQIMFAVFFLSLLIMLLFSNGIIAYASLLRSSETAFLFTSPTRSAHIYVYKILDALLFSSWAFLFLAFPLIVAVGITEKAPWIYYPGAVLFFATFALLPAALGGAIVLLIARFLSRSPKRVLIFMAAVIAIPAALWGFGVVQAWRFGVARATESWMQGVLGRLSLSQFPLLPSCWTSNGMLYLARGQLREAGFNYLLLLSTALFVGMVSVHLAQWIYIPAYHRTHSLLRRRRGRAGGSFYRLLEHLPGMSPELRTLVIKDVKTFLRDPAQWSQVLLFFGLLGVYFVNMRNLQYDVDSPFWQNLISLLNLIATSLTLSTFTSRFIFPLLSLEGRKFWILGLLPLDRKNLLYSKFWFAFFGAFVISEGLMMVSDMVLRVAPAAMALHAITVLIVCAGLSGLAVGIGALYPNLREDNPSKIVSGFGGTLNLVLSVLFVAIVVVGLAVPYHLDEMGKVTGAALRWFRIVGGFGALATGVLAVVLPLTLGLRAFRRLEA
jgi:ABC-2 type transport system permease protein